MGMRLGQRVRHGKVEDGQCCEIKGVGSVGIQHAKNLLGDAIFKLVVTNGTDVASICHLGRSIPTALKLALWERDRTCAVPGCDRTEGLEIDHRLVDFADHGPATMENLARICHAHHLLRTHHGFQLLGGPGHWQWVPPSHRPPSTDPPGPAGRRGTGTGSSCTGSSGTDTGTGSSCTGTGETDTTNTGDQTLFRLQE